MDAPQPPQDIWRRPRHLFPTFRKLFGWMFSWRAIRACLFVLVCLVTLIGLFYAVENWRGRWAWNRFKHELQAKGEQVDWQSFVPPPVPDDQNFAMTPLLKPVLDYELRPDPAHGRVHWRDTNGLNRLWNLSLQRPEVATNPPAISGEWKTGKRIDLTAWQGYFRWVPPPSKNRQPGATGFPNSFPVADKPQAPAEDVSLALSRFDPELSELQAACARPYARFPVHYGEGMGTLLPHLAIMKNVSQIATLRTVAELEVGRNDQAIQDIQLSLHTADALQAEPFCISHLVRLAIIDQSLQPIWEGLAAHRWSSNQLVSLMGYLQPVDLLSDYARVVRSERSLGGLVNTFSDRKQRMEFLYNMFPGEALHAGFILMLDYYPKGWLYLNDLAAARFYQETVLPLVNPVERRAYPAQARAAIREFEDAPARPGNSIVKYFGVFIAPQRFARGQTDINLAWAACALERYRQVHQEFPQALGVLAPAYLDHVPLDVITGQPLKYRRTPDGQFLLYSVGWDETDDGGQFPTAKAGPPERRHMRQWANDTEEEGDWVWRYPATRPSQADKTP